MSKLITLRQGTDLLRLLLNGKVTCAQVEERMKDKKGLVHFFKTGEARPLLIIPHQVIQEIYLELGIECEIPKDIQVPRGVETGDLWTVIVPKGMTPGKAFKIASKLFKTRKWTEKDLDEVINEKAEETTISFFKANIEADPENKNKSAKDLKKEKGRTGINLTQRIMLEIIYFKLTGQHLDIENVTLCDESRYADGCVPYVFWSGDKMNVCWYDVGIANYSLRSRSAVSVPT